MISEKKRDERGILTIAMPQTLEKLKRRKRKRRERERQVIPSKKIKYNQTQYSIPQPRPFINNRRRPSHILSPFVHNLKYTLLSLQIINWWGRRPRRRRRRIPWRNRNLWWGWWWGGCWHSIFLQIDRNGSGRALNITRSWGSLCSVRGWCSNSTRGLCDSWFFAGWEHIGFWGNCGWS